MNCEWGIADMRDKLRFCMEKIADHDAKFAAMGGNHIETAQVIFDKKGRAKFMFDEPFSKPPEISGAELVKWVGKYKGAQLKGTRGETVLVTAS